MSSTQHRRGRAKRPRQESSHTTQNSEFSHQQSQPPSSHAASISSQHPSSRTQASNTAPSSSFPPLQTQSPYSHIHPPRGKVAIPALRPIQAPGPPEGNKKGRTTHACDFCRKAKAGCTGGHPCERCGNADVPCIYGDGKRDRERKKLSQLIQEATSLTQHNSDIIEALRKLRQNTSMSVEGMRTAIDQILTMSAAYSTMGMDNLDPSLSQFSPRSEDPSEENQDSDMGSTGSLDVVNVDTDQEETRATGYIGKASAVSWAKRTALECDTKTHHESTLGTHKSGFALASYHTEDADIEFVDLSSVNAFDWPDYETANDLVGLYFENIHSLLPLMDRQSFYSKYETFFRGSADLSPEDSVWLGTLNIMFAISAVYGHLIKRYGPHQHQQHLIYLKRAQMLCLDHILIFEDVRVSTCRVLGLLCLYFVSTCQLNRAWTTCGLAIRQALILGLQVRSHASGLSDYEKEQRIRLWWSLYSLECLLNELTGRPSCISDQDISAPLPVNVNEDELQQLAFVEGTSPSSEHFTRRSSKTRDSRPTATFQMPTGIPQPLIYKFPTLSLPPTTSTHFIYRIQLCIVSHEIVTQLYCAATTKAKWTEVQETILRIDRRLLAWRDSLPQEFSIVFDEWTEPNWNDPHIMQRLGLAMTFNSSRMILYRPCLCRFERRMEAHSAEFNDFNRQGAEKCIRSARTMISLIHWCASRVERLYTITPWWNTLHCICEALSVLMLEMAFQAQHLPHESAYILDDAKNGVRWLRTMAGESVSARKAWEIFDCLVRLVAPMINWSVYDMPTVAPIPPGYNWRRFQTAGATLPPLQNQQQTHQAEQLNEVNLQNLQYDVNQAVDQNAATTAWNTDQNFTFGTSENPHTEFGFAMRAQQAGVGDEQVSNPLDHTTAVEMFGSIGGLHGHYDEPWQHMFASNLGEPSVGRETEIQGLMGQTEFQGYGGNVPTEQHHRQNTGEGYQQTRFGY